MSTDFETLLRARLHEETPDPPHGLDPAAPRLRARRDRRQFVAITAVVLCVLGIAIGLVVSQSGSNPTPPAKDPLSSIENVVWKDTQSTGTVVFHNGTMRLYEGCVAQLYDLKVRGGRIIEGPQLGHSSPCMVRGHVSYGRLPRFFRVVGGAPTWQRRGKQLVLSSDGNGSITLRTDGKPAPEITGTLWRLQTVNAGNLEGGGAGWLRIRTDGTFRASDGCNFLGGGASVSATTLRLGFAPLRANGCPKVHWNDSQVLKILSGPMTYRITGNQLVLDGGRRGRLAYRAVR